MRFPGGHVEDDETLEAALRRELVEELGVAATISGPPDDYVRGTTFRMAVRVVDGWEGEPRNLEPAGWPVRSWLGGVGGSQKLLLTKGKRPSVVLRRVGSPL